MSKQKIELDADAFDTLEFSALVYRGIGAEAWDVDGGAKPFCIGGHVSFAGGYDSDARALLWSQVSKALAPSLVRTNNEAVKRINRRKGKTGELLNDRVTWPEYTRELNIVRKAS